MRSHVATPTPPGKTFVRNRAGFTLIELLVVLAIIAILAVIAIPAVSSIQAAMELETTVQQVTAQLNTARQYALTTSHPVQVRFYSLPGYRNGNASVYRAMQSFVEWDNAVTPIGKPFFFAVPFVIALATSNGTDVSSLLTSSYSGITVVNTADTANPLPPPYGTSYSYAYFHFRSNGKTDLSIATSVNSLLTIIQQTASTSHNGLPSNYATLQINAITGTVSTYRP